jgi:hypothetical protein
MLYTTEQLLPERNCRNGEKETMLPPYRPASRLSRSQTYVSIWSVARLQAIEIEKKELTSFAVLRY